MDWNEYFENFYEREWQDAGTVEPLRIAVVGLGAFARNRALPALEGADFCDATVVVSGSADKRRRVADEFSVETAIGYDVFRDGAATDTYDAAYVATPTASHLEYARVAADFGKHVICEKPLEASVERGERMRSACVDADVALMVAYRHRFEPVVRRARELLEADVVGEPVHLRGGFANPILARGDPDQWRLDPDLAGGGALMDLGIYPLNAARFLLDTDPITVNAMTHGDENAFGGVERDIAFQLEFPDATTGSFTASFDAHPSSNFAIVGSGGRITLDSVFGDEAHRYNVLERGASRVEFDGPQIDEVREEFDYFAHAVRTGAAELDGSDGLTDLRVAEAAYESAETGRRVTV